MSPARPSGLSISIYTITMWCISSPYHLHPLPVSTSTVPPGPSVFPFLVTMKQSHDTQCPSPANSCSILKVSLALPLCAALVSPIGHHWFNFLNTAIVGSGLQVGAARVTLDQFVFSPVSPLGNRRRATVPGRLIPSGFSLHPWQHNRILIPSGQMTIFVMDLVRSRQS